MRLIVLGKHLVWLSFFGGWYLVTYPLLPVLVYIIPGLCVTLWMAFLQHMLEKHPAWTALSQNNPTMQSELCAQQQL